MSALHRFEQRLEHMVTGAFARVFRSAVQPMEIASALQREVDNAAQVLSRDRRIAPNDFTVELSGVDYDRLATYGQTLSDELASMLHENAQAQNYLFAGPISLNFVRADDLTTGRFRVRSRASAQVTQSPDHHPAVPPVGPTSMFLEINGARHRVQAPGIVLGRGSNADLRIDDPGISRRHVQFRVDVGEEEALSVVDLGSTNGTQVNGHRVQRATLQDGAVVQIGNTRITVRINTSGAPGAPSGPYSSHADPAQTHRPPSDPPQPYRAQPYQPPAQPYQAQPYQPEFFPTGRGPGMEPDRPTTRGAPHQHWRG